MRRKYIQLIAVLAILCSCTPSKTNEGYEDYDWTALEKHLENPIKIPIDTMLDVSMKMRKLGTLTYRSEETTEDEYLLSFVVQRNSYRIRHVGNPSACVGKRNRDKMT